MILGPIALLNIVADVTLLLSALALATIMLWQDRHPRGRAFAVCMVVFAFYAATDLLWQVARPFDLAPRPFLESATALYTVGITLLSLFALAFGRLPVPVRRLAVAFSIPLACVFVALSATGQMYTDIRLIGRGAYGHEMTPAGLVGVLTAVAYLGAIVVLLWRHGTTRSRALVQPIGLLAVGVVLHTLAVPLRIYAVNISAVTVAIIMMGRTLVRYEVFKPLADLNAALIVKNTELQEAARLKSQFLANMTHELRTPLNSIIGYTEMIIAGTYGGLNERQLDRLRRINRNGIHLLSLINDVLDLSKIEAGRLELARARVAISPLVETVCVEMAPRAIAKELELIIEIAPDLPPVWVDEMRIHQILEKLLENAVAFTDHGSITVRAGYDAAQNEVVLSVADTGCGVEPAQRALVFDAFLPGSGRRADPRKGPGLGLAIAYRLAVLHGGRMWFDTVLGEGSTFYVAFPALQDKTATAEHPRVVQQERDL